MMANVQVKEPQYADQNSCQFCKLPRELRDQIYQCLFSSTKFMFGECYGETMKTQPAPCSLAILQTCRQIYNETRSMWLSEVLFSFEKPEDLLDTLSAQPSTIVSQIRHLRVRGGSLQLRPRDDATSFWFGLSESLKLLPQLRLDTLTILATVYEEYAHDTLNCLLQHGHGWKELHYIASDSRVLAISKLNYDRRKAQSGDWQKTLLDRDGPQSGARVTMYRAKPNIHNSLEDASCEIFEENLLDELQWNYFGIDYDQMLPQEAEKPKQVLVVAKRGRNADISLKGQFPFDRSDIRSYGMAWEDMRQYCVESPCLGSTNGPRKATVE